MRFFKPERVMGGNNGELVWWHVSISLKLKWLMPFPLNDVSCTLSLDGNIKTDLCFRPLQGIQPEHRINIHGGDIRHIPICARATTDNYLLGFSAPYVLLSGELAENWAMKRGIARITDGNHYFTYDNLTNLIGPQTHVITLQMKIGQKPYAEKRYVLTVPAANENNDAFVFAEE